MTLRVPPTNRFACAVYNISILSNIPLSTAEIISPRSPPHRLRPLFTVGVHDIPFLMSGAKPSPDDADTSQGWIACTTDSILATKDNLRDMLITMPPAHAANARHHTWPTIECPRGAEHAKATQRDLRRYRALRMGLARLQKKPKKQRLSTPSDSTAAAAAAGKSSSSNSKDTEQTSSTELTEDDERRLIEPLTWAAFAYGGFMWWASAGEQARSDEAEEAAHDASLLADLSSSATPFTPTTMSMSAGGGNRQSVDLSTSMGSLARAPSGAGADDEDDDEEEARVELAVIAYFHRLTTRILGTLSDALDLGSDGYSDSESEFDEDQDQDDPSASRRGPRDDDHEGEASAAEDEGDESEALLRPADDEEEDANGAGRQQQRTTRGARSRSRNRRPSGRNSIPVGSETVAAMGLDVWSGADAAFVAEAAARYFGRRAHVEGKGVEVCGVRVC